MCGEAPAPTSKYTQGRRLFADGRVDRNGLLRRLPSAGDRDDDCHDSLSDSDPSDDDDGTGAPGALQRVAQLFESESDEERTQRGAKRAKAQAGTFRAVPVQISTTPIKAKPIAEPLDWSKYVVSSDSEPDTTPRPAKPVARPSKPIPRPKIKGSSSIANNTSAAPDVKGKGRAEPVEVPNFTHSTTYVVAARHTNCLNDLAGKRVKLCRFR